MTTKRAEAARLHRINCKKAGRCYRCPKQAMLGRTKCTSCSESQSKKGLAKYYQKRESGTYSPSRAIREAKAVVMSHYGPACSCGVAFLSMLTIDHIDNNGAAHRREGKNQGTHLYRKLISAGFPAGYQCLCWNCNFKKHRLRQIAAHSDSITCVRNRASKWKLKIETLAAYGGACVCCGIDDPLVLNIDHINNNGSSERKTIGEGIDFYRWLRRSGYPEGYQVLCYNCNCSKHILGSCEHCAS